MISYNNNHFLFGIKGHFGLNSISSAYIYIQLISYKRYTHSMESIYSKWHRYLWVLFMKSTVSAFIFTSFDSVSEDWVDSEYVRFLDSVSDISEPTLTIRPRPRRLQEPVSDSEQSESTRSRGFV